MLNGFETEAEIGAVASGGTRLAATAEHATQGKQALRIEFQPGTAWPSAAFAAPAPWDWQDWDVLMVDVTNPGTTMVEVGVGFGDTPGPDGAKHWCSGTTKIAPGSTVTVGFPLKGDVQDTGMDGLPSQTVHCVMLHSYGDAVDLKRVALFSIFTPAQQSPTAVVVDNIRLAPKTRLDGIVDQFGQYTGADWPGKVHQVADLETARVQEAADWKQHPAPADRDRFGGWAGGPQLPATGCFRTQKVDGKWWLVDPDGRLFFSIGITTINHDIPSDQFTRITGRESMFSWLPADDDPLYARHMSVRDGQRFFNFYATNLERKYGTGYATAWLDATRSRLLSWGFNTVGDFSAPPVLGMGVPYCVTMGAWGGHWGVRAGDIDIDDPYDPQFATDLANNLKSLASQVPQDPYCIGYFVDNELSWGGSATDHLHYAVALAVLRQGADSPAKRALLAQLRASYPDIAALNARWGTDLPNWEALTAPFSPNGAQEAAMKDDLAAFMKSFCSRYYQTVRDTLKAHDPHHLYLGDKYMVSRYTPESLQAAVTYCDVVSFDIYETEVASPQWEFLKTLDKPCIIGEFHFGALDRGLFGAGMVAVSTQAQRAAAYERYVRSVAEHSAFVGCHWFQYVDEPLTGRAFDRENHNIGFVNAGDNPYPELVAAARRTATEVYSRRAGR